MDPQPGRFGHVSKLRSLLEEGGWWHSFELPDGTVIRGANSLEGLRERIAHFPIPEDLRGKRVLDIGSWDGWFAFEMERRGADVMAVDIIDSPRFREIHRVLQSRIDYRQMDVYDLTPAKVGQFDIVLFMGVLYHLKHPLLGLERLCALTKDLAAVDSFVLQAANADGVTLERPLMEFFETDEFGGQVDNWVAPNVPCLLAMCRTAGFARAVLHNVGEFGASVACFRQWDPPAQPDLPAPTLVYLAHHTNFGINFDSSKDDYVTAWFNWSGAHLSRADVRPVVGPFGVAPILLRPRLESPDSGQWETGFRIPPGLPPGWHDVRIAVADGPSSNAMRLALDVPLQVDHVAILGARDGKDWTPGRLIRQNGDGLSLWLAGLPGNADAHNLRILIDGVLVPVTYLADPDPLDRQVNCVVPSDFPPGAHTIAVQIGSVRAETVFEIV